MFICRLGWWLMFFYRLGCRNPAVRALSGYSYDLNLGEKAVGSETSSMQCASLPFRSSSPEQDFRTGLLTTPEDTRSWIPPKWCFPGMSYSSSHSAGSNDTREEGMGDGSNLQLETLHEWGSDLELASPRMFDTCILGSSWTTGVSTVPFSGVLTSYVCLLLRCSVPKCLCSLSCELQCCKAVSFCRALLDPEAVLEGRHT
jgi:hypothetical protein